MKLFKPDDTMSAALPHDAEKHYLANYRLLDVPFESCVPHSLYLHYDGPYLWMVKRLRKHMSNLHRKAAGLFYAGFGE